MRLALGADLPTLGTLGLGVGRPTAVVGFLDLVLGLGHEFRSE